MCVSIGVCVCACMYVCVHVCMYVCICGRMCVCDIALYFHYFIVEATDIEDTVPYI